MVQPSARVSRTRIDDVGLHEMFEIALVLDVIRIAQCRKAR